jgi:hypothetical protein
MAKARLPSLAILLSLVIATLARGGDDPHSIVKIAKSLAELQNQAPVVHYKFEKTVVWPKGSMNMDLELSDYEMKRRQKLAAEKRAKNLPFQWEDLGQGIDIPSEDITSTSREESIRDLDKGMGWSKGEKEACEFARDANDLPRLKYWLEPFEGAFDGRDSYERVDPASSRFRDTEKKIRVPVEFSIWRITAERGETSPSPEWLPRIFCEGGLPVHKQPEAQSRNDWPFLADRWTRGAEEQDSEGHPIIYSLPWPAEIHYQCSLRPDLHYVPCKWRTFYYNQLTAELEIEYEPASNGIPVLQSWKYTTFYNGKLQEMRTFRVVSFKRESSVDPALFHMEPPDGQIVMEIKTEREGCYVAGRKAIRGQSVTEVNDKLQLYENRFQWFNGILAGCSLLVGTVVVLIFRRFRRRSATSSREQELPA